ncbi:MAG: type II toxin-antitoxin system Phd/YefM family antitoxin [Puniceicoccales bacterium]|jgi:antitoxin (DNA-binding transcriptional repressor) of toxin-antitoxin stability system|nr:type II toxin-antitoxin system Phd/YefM family antitoxin [Puniceicoccales bacterium]
MTTITTTDLQARSAYYIADIEHGKTEYLIVNNDRPVARLIPFVRQSSRTEALRRLAAIPARPKIPGPIGAMTTKELILQGRK